MTEREGQNKKSGRRAIDIVFDLFRYNYNTERSILWEMGPEGQQRLADWFVSLSNLDYHVGMHAMPAGVAPSMERHGIGRRDVVGAPIGVKWWIELNPRNDKYLTRALNNIKSDDPTAKEEGLLHITRSLRSTIHYLTRDVIKGPTDLVIFKYPRNRDEIIHRKDRQKRGVLAEGMVTPDKFPTCSGYVHFPKEDILGSIKQAPKEVPYQFERRVIEQISQIPLL